MANTDLFRLEELGTSKAVIKRRFFADYERDDDDQWSNRIKAILSSRRSRFTIEELKDLVAVLDTSHHQCVMDNTDDFHPLVVATHVRLQAKLDRWDDLIRQRELADAPRVMADDAT